MVKVPCIKAFKNYTINVIEKEIDDFLGEREINSEDLIDIKWTHNNDGVFSALVIYSLEIDDGKD